MQVSDPFHSGEREIQEKTGERRRALMLGHLISSSITETVRSFVAQQQYCVLGQVSPDKEIWASFLTGRKGFASSDETGATLSLEPDDGIGRLQRSPPFETMQRGDQLGVLFIELTTRRRLRVNGQVAELSKTGLCLTVAEAFQNCSKYIQRRARSPRAATPGSASVEEGKEINAELTTWISSADTFFVASAQPDGGVDVSHRGGRPGFVKVEGGSLHIPDYPGNSMFATLGNFAVNPRAGLVFLDFQTNRQLQLTGDARLDFDSARPVGETGGSGRWWVFTPRRWMVSDLSRTFNWTLLENSPFNP